MIEFQEITGERPDEIRVNYRHADTGEERSAAVKTIRNILAKKV